eukprot:1713886-Lingulodinium_polyedra.AAC.1
MAALIPGAPNSIPFHSLLMLHGSELLSPMASRRRPHSCWLGFPAAAAWVPPEASRLPLAWCSSWL